VTARDDAANIAAAALQKALFVEVNGGEMEHVATVYKPEGQALVLRQAVLDALEASGVLGPWAVETGALERLERLEWCTDAHVLTSVGPRGICAAEHVPVFRVADRTEDTAQ
jgi:hypothetical protein